MKKSLREFNVLYCVFVVLFASTLARAQDYSRPPSDGEILVEKPTDLSLSYKQRRDSFGGIFSVNYEKFNPEEYFSVIQNKTYDEITDGEAISLFGAEIGVKYNFSFGSMAALLGYSAGRISNDAQNLDDLSLNITKVDLNLTLDNLMSEPWIAPYGQIGVQQIQWEETSFNGTDALTESLKSEPNFHIKAGLLFQLNWIENWIDPNTTTEGRRSSGLENTFIDVFYTQYTAFAKSDDVTVLEDADLSSTAMGVGLKLEF